MGNGSPTKRPPGGLKSLFAEYAKRVKHLTVFLAVLCFVFLSLEEISAQDFANLSEKIVRGNSEDKRSALFEIRNFQTAAASRIAVPALRDADEIVRATAAFSILYLPPEEAAQNLLPLLQDKSPFVRKETAYALGKTQHTSAILPLIELIGRDKFQEVKDAATVALGEIGNEAAVATLVEILRRKPKTEQEFFRRAAARSIGQIAQTLQINLSTAVTPESFLPDKYKLTTKPEYKNLAAENPRFREAIFVLTKIVENSKESGDTRREAAFAIGTIGDSAAVRILKNKLSAEDYYLVEIAEESLKKSEKI